VNEIFRSKEFNRVYVSFNGTPIFITSAFLLDGRICRKLQGSFKILINYSLLNSEFNSLFIS